MNKPIVTIVAVCFNEEQYNMPFVDSMLNQTVTDGWQVYLLHNGPADSCRGYKQIQQRIQGDNRFLCRESETNTGNWGCDNRKWAIDNCTTPYILQTSVQDYMLPDAMKYILSMLEQKPDCALFNAINHIVAPCQMLDCQLAWSKIDWGMAAVKTSIAKQVGISQPAAYTADWIFFNECIQRKLFNKVLKNSGILTIHN